MTWSQAGDVDFLQTNAIHYSVFPAGEPNGGGTVSATACRRRCRGPDALGDNALDISRFGGTGSQGERVWAIFPLPRWMRKIFRLLRFEKEGNRMRGLTTLPRGLFFGLQLFDE